MQKDGDKLVADYNLYLRTLEYKERRDMIEPTLNPETLEVNFTLSNKYSIVCPHCQSGWVIITLGIENHIVKQMAMCSTIAAKREFYCPYCGKDMTEIFRWK